MKSKTLKSINPATLEVVGEVEATPPKKVESIVEQARQAFSVWRDLGLEARTRILKRAQQCLLDECEAFAGLITEEMGRPVVESMVMELEASVDLMGYYTKRAERFLGDRRVPLHNVFFKRRRSTLHFEPLGVLGVISPWNWPLLIPLGCIVPALLAGNAVVFKPSELTPLFGLKIRELFLEAGLPDGVFQVVQGAAAVGKALVESRVEKIFFTGSTAVGQEVMEEAARSFRKAVLEMGGSDPAIVCEDADLDVSSSGIVWGGYSNCGQNCNGVERVYVNETIARAFIDRIVEKVKQLRVGNGASPDTDVGPLASEAQRDKMENIVRNAVNKGAEVLTGGHRMDGLPGYFFEPTVILWDKAIPQPVDEEIFGPIVYVTPVKDDDEAVGLANRSTFGLAGSVWTASVRRGRQIAHRLESGTVMINDVIVSFGMSEVSWTGVKRSGVGWVHGEKGLDEMVNIKYINRDPQSHTQKFWWFPYNAGMVRGMKAGMDFLFARRLGAKLKSIPDVLRSFTGYLVLNRKRGDKL